MKHTVLILMIALLQLSFSQAKENFEKYKRSLYRHWIDADNDCQNTRAEILIRTSIEDVTFKTARKCAVLTGFWVDPYSGLGFTEAKHLDIDHIIPLKAAHDLGARLWTRKQRQEFANDYENLIPVQARLNRQKGAKGPWSWLPPNPSFKCDYISNWEKLTKKYSLKKSETTRQWLGLKDGNKNCTVQVRQPAQKNK